ncbi:MAG: nucleotide exchange factor GrpE [Blautia sp.]|nr:nucleotide exchange factor GrpE [Blautia sp.]
MTEEKMTPETEETVPTEAANEESVSKEADTPATEADNGKKDKKADKKLKAELEEVKKALEAEQKRAEELNDKYLRLCAEYDNFRKRSQKEKENTYGDAVTDTLTGLLPVIDNLQYAAKYGNADPAQFAEGVKMILDKLPENLEKLNIKPFGVPGDTFDPNLHNAILHVDDEAYGEGEIVEVLQGGYMYGEKVIRYAMVKVAN